MQPRPSRMASLSLQDDLSDAVKRFPYKQERPFGFSSVSAYENEILWTCVWRKVYVREENRFRRKCRRPYVSVVGLLFHEII